MLRRVVNKGYFKIKLLPYGKVDIVTQEFALSIFPLEDEILYTIYFHEDGVTESISKGEFGFHSYSTGIIQPGHDLHVDKYLKDFDGSEHILLPNAVSVIRSNKLLLSLKPFKDFSFSVESSVCAKWYPMYFAFHFPGSVVTKVQFANVMTYSGDSFEIFQEIDTIEFFQDKYEIEDDLRAIFKRFRR